MAPPMPTPIPGLAIQVTPAAGAGPGATAAITACSLDCDRGHFAIQTQPGGSTGLLATVTFGAVYTGTARGRTTAQPHPDSDQLMVGSLSDPDIRPIVLGLYPSPAGVVHLLAVPTFDTPPTSTPGMTVNPAPRMTGFQVLCNVVPPAGTWVVAWAIL